MAIVTSETVIFDRKTREEREYWVSKLSQPLGISNIGLDYQRPVARSPQKDVVGMELTGEVYDKLISLTGESPFLLYTALMAALKVTIHRYTGSSTVVVGSPTHQKGERRTQPPNAVAIVDYVNGSMSFQELLLNVRQTLQEAYAKQRYPFSRLLKDLGLADERNRCPVFDIVLALDGIHGELPQIHNDIDITFHRRQGSLAGVIAYRPDLFKRESIERFAGCYVNALNGALNNTRTTVTALPLLSPAEQEQILVKWNDTRWEHSDEFCVHQLFEIQAECMPETVAFSHGDHQLTYGELNRKANQLAHYLKSCGISEELLVALCVERSADLVIGILGVLKAGGAYVPMDPTYPPERLAFMLEDSESPVLLTQERLLERVRSSLTQVVCLDTDRPIIDQQPDRNPGGGVSAQNLAYLIYTSGSTGQPKGVEVSHGALLNLVCWHHRFYQISRLDRATQLASIGFDASVWEVWPYLAAGASIHLPDEDTRMLPDRLQEWLATRDISIGFLPTPVAEAVLSLEWPSQIALKRLLVGGDKLHHYPGEQIPFELFNNYGPTENAVVATAGLIVADETAEGPPSIGKPIDNTTIYLLDGQLEPLPAGLPSELYIGGRSLARGYHGRPELTAERFIPNPYSGEPGQRLYTTGDLACFRPGGEVDFLGRADYQVKIRGHRIELGEIEATLAEHPLVQEVVVTAREIIPGSNQLVAYVVLRDDTSPSHDEWRRYLRDRLPDYMLPSAFVTMDALPLTPNGKIDRRTLPTPEQRRPEQEETFVAPRTPTEQDLSEVWAEILGLERVGIHDNYFELGGDSIRSIQIAAKAQERGLSLSLHQLFKYPTIAELAEVIGTAQREAGPTRSLEAFALISESDRLRVPDGVQDAYPLTHMQAGMVFHSQYSPETAAVYHNVLTYHLQAPFDADAMRAAVEGLIERHAVLRTSFDLSNFSEPLQLVHREVALPLEIQDLRHLEQDEQNLYLISEFQEEKERFFNWNQAPLVRLKFYRRTEDAFHMMLVFHHAVLDGWSDSTLMTELFSLYWSLMGDSTLDIGPAPTATFRDYVALEREAIASVETQQYWREKLTNVSATRVPRWPGPKEAQAQHMQMQVALIPDEVSQALNTLAKSTGVPIKSVVLAAHLKLLAWISGQKNVVTGYVLNGRPEGGDGERILGLFVNTLPFALELTGGTWRELVKRSFEAEREVLPHRRLPLAMIKKMMGGLPLFEVAFNFTHFHVVQRLSVFEGKLSGSAGYGAGENNFALLASFSLDPFTSKLRLNVCFDDGEFRPEQIDALIGYYLRTLEAMASDPEKRHELHSPISEEERHRLLLEWNDALPNRYADCSIHGLFQEQAARTPDAVAVVGQEQQITYGELNQRSNQLAHHLQAFGVGNETAVGLCLERSVEVVVCILGILKAGGAYVPVDIRYPVERQAFMIDDAQIAVVLTRERHEDRLPAGTYQMLCVDRDWPEISSNSWENPSPLTTPEQVAYVSYTSGSTGRPKGVQVCHQGIVRLVMEADYAQLDDRKNLLQLSPLSFDASSLEIWGALLVGGKCVLYPNQMIDAEGLGRAISDDRVNTLWLTSSLFNVVVDENLAALSSVEQLLVGGEALSVGHVSRAIDRLKTTKLINGYGPTEGTTFTCCYSLAGSDDASGERIPIGRPIRSTQVYALDRDKCLVPIGVRGELHIGGEGLARGYLNRPELTADKFIPNPHSLCGGERLYRSGDVVTYLPDGRLDCIGRGDNQVKLRGYRIELEEIERRIEEHPGVDKAVVLLKEGERGEKRLIAYYSGVGDEPLSATRLREHLEERVPEYMIPGTFASVKEMPLTSSGKVDRRSFVDADSRVEERGHEYAEATTEKQRILAAIWSEVLGVERVGIRDSFFTLGGDSIISIQIAAKAKARGMSFTIEALFEHPTIEELAELAELEDSGQADEQRAAFSLISETDRARLPEDVEDAYPLTRLQAGMVFHSEYMPETAVYHDIMSYHLQGEMVEEALREALAEMISRHSVLRTSFDLTGYSEAMQLVHRNVEVPLEVKDFSGLSESEQEEELRKEIQNERAREFDWSRAPLLRLRVYLRGEENYQVMMSFHHAILDGWSLASLMTELYQRYSEKLKKGEHRGLELVKPLSSSYRDYVALEREAAHSEECRAYWDEKLRDCELVKIPRWPREAATTTVRKVGRREIPLSPWVAEGLSRLAADTEVPLKSVMLAAHLRVLSLISGQNDVTTGMVWHGRLEGTDGERVLGLFLNTVPFRFRLPGGSWERLVKDTFDTEREMIPYRRFPMAEMQRRSGRPLFETSFDFLRFHVYRQLEGMQNDVALLAKEEVTETNFTLALHCYQNPFTSGLGLILDYDDSELSREQVEAIGGYYVATLEAMASEPKTPYEFHTPLSYSERHQLLTEWNDNALAPGEVRLIHQLFELQVERTPDSVALVFDDKVQTYAELNRLANELAWRLRSMGVGPEAHVGICANRRLDMVTAILGILKAGGAYVPLDPDYPTERLAFILADAQISVLVTQHELAASLPHHDCELLYLKGDSDSPAGAWQTNPPHEVTDRNLAYVIYTSGSTGQPKGVAIEHNSAAALVEWARQTYQPEELAGVLAATSLCFDLSIFELFVPLSCGGTVVIAENALAAPSLIDASRVRLINTVPSAMAELARAGGLPSSVQTVNLAGEPLGANLAEQVYELEGVQRLFNLYGPSEATTYSTFSLIQSGSHLAPSIGRPVSNSQAYVLSERLEIVPPGAKGELYLSGAGLARGYLSEAAMTAEKFVPNPFGSSEGLRLYKTGDLARYRPDGNIDFLGRRDTQVKVRGFRIELGEAEEALTRHPAVREAVVVCRQDGEGLNRLVAYVVPQETILPAALRAFLSERLPRYMVPEAFVLLEALPLTVTGKIDRRTLSDRGPLPADSEVVYEAPRTQTEELVAQIWTDVLGLSSVGIRENFFELGGHSLTATRVISRLRATFQVDVPLRALFDSPTVAALAAAVDKAQMAGRGIQAPPIERVPRDGRLPLSFGQQRLWLFDQLTPRSSVYNNPTAVRLRGPVNLGALNQSFDEIVRRHEVLRTTFADIDGEPFQVIAPPSSSNIPQVDLSGLPLDKREEKARELALEEGSRPFDLNQGPVIRLGVVRLDEHDHLLLLTLHHIVTDGWSTNVLTSESLKLIETFAVGEPSPLSELTVQYADYAHWQRQWLQGESLEASLAYWKHQLGDDLPVLRLPTDRPRPEIPTWRGEMQSSVLPPALLESLRDLSRRERVTLFMTLLASFQTLLHRYTGQDDVVVGTDIASRNRAEIEGLIGLFVNLVVLRTRVVGKPTFREVLAQVREVTLGAYAHQEMPFDRLVEELRPERKLNLNPLFQVLFILQNTPRESADAAPFGLQAGATSAPSRFDLTLSMTETRWGLVGTWRYNTDIFDAATITRMMRHFETLLGSIAAQPDTGIDVLEIFTEAEKKERLSREQDREASKLKRLRAIKPRTVSLPQEHLIKRASLSDGQTLPVLMEPAIENVDLTGWARANRKSIDESLSTHGAILFRGFNILSVTDFEEFALSASTGLFNHYGDLPRESVGRNIYGSTPYPAEQSILFHNESSHMHHWPGRIFFFCVQAAQRGGETPIVDCRKVYQKLDPRIRLRFEQKKLMYVRNYIEGLDVGWQEFFQTSDRAAVEELCRRTSVEFAWSSRGALKTRRLCDAVIEHPVTGEKLFFNQIQLHHPFCLDPAVRASLLSLVDDEGEMPRNVYYGDGSPIEASVISELLQIYKETAISFPWRGGDILMLDNMLTAHGRNAFVGPRKIVVAMGDMIRAEQLVGNGGRS